MKHKVLISAPYMHREKEKVTKMLKDYNFDVTWIETDERLEETDILPVISKYHGILCGDDKITPKVIDAATNLKAIVKWGTGIDSIDKKYAESRGIKVFRTTNAFTEPVSETAIGMMLNETRGLARNNRVFKSGRWEKPQGYTLAEKTIGIIGFGNIGRAVAKKLIPFCPRVLANDIIKIPKEIVKQLNVEMVSKDQIYKESDIITIHSELNSDNIHMLNKTAFSKMKRKPFVINTSRGHIIKENDLIIALKTGLISGIGIDVFEHEPLAQDSPLRKMDTVTASCHNSNSSPNCWDTVHKSSLNMMAKGLGLK